MRCVDEAIDDLLRPLPRVDEVLLGVLQARELIEDAVLGPSGNRDQPPCPDIAFARLDQR